MANFLQDGQAVFAWQLEVEQDEHRQISSVTGRVLAKTVQEVERLDAVFRPNDFVGESVLAQRANCKGGIVSVVFDEKDHVVTPERKFRRPSRVLKMGSLELVPPLRVSVKVAPSPEFAVGGDPPVVPGDNALNNREADAGAREVGLRVRTLKRPKILSA